MPGLLLALVMLPIARPLAGARPPRLADAALPDRGVRDHGAGDAALVPGLHRRHDLPHPGAGLAAGRVELAAGRGADRPRRDRRCGGCGAAGRGRPRARPAGPVRREALHEDEAVPPGRRTAGGLSHSPTASTTGGSAIAGSGEIFFGQYGYYGADLSNRVQYIGVPGPDGEHRLADDLPRVPPPGQRRRLRLPGHEPGHPGLARRRLLVPGPAPGSRTIRPWSWSSRSP